MPALRISGAAIAQQRQRKMAEAFASWEPMDDSNFQPTASCSKGLTRPHPKVFGYRRNKVAEQEAQQTKRQQAMGLLFSQLEGSSVTRGPITPVSERKFKHLPAFVYSPLSQGPASPPHSTDLQSNVETLTLADSTVPSICVTPAHDPICAVLDFSDSLSPPHNFDATPTQLSFDACDFTVPPLDLNFCSNLELETRNRRAVANDELAYLLEGADPHRPAAMRTAALTSLGRWVCKQEALAHLRCEARVQDVLHTASVFDLSDEAMVGACLKILVTVATDPANHAWVDATTWQALLSVLDHSHACFDSSSVRESSPPPLESSSEPSSSEMPSKRMRTANGSGFRRPRRFLSSSTHASQGDASVQQSSNTAESLKSLALTGLIGTLIARNRCAVFAELEAGDGQPTWASTADSFRQWFSAAQGWGIIKRLIHECHRNWSQTKSPASDRTVMLALQLLELLTCPAPGNTADTAMTGVRDILPELVEALVAVTPKVDGTHMEAIPTSAIAKPKPKGSKRPQKRMNCQPKPHMASKDSQVRGLPVSIPLQNTILRVIINICALIVHDPPRGPVLYDLISACCSLLYQTVDVDALNCCLCLLINLTEWDGTARTLAGSGRLIPFLAALFEERIAGGTTVGNIVAAYSALLLGCLTINHSVNLQAVRAALRNNNCATTEAPMVRIVAVLQEFLLFQSEAHVLTQSTLRGLHHVITEVAEANDIILPRRTN